MRIGCSSILYKVRITEMHLHEYYHYVNSEGRVEERKKGCVNLGGLKGKVSAPDVPYNLNTVAVEFNVCHGLIGTGRAKVKGRKDSNSSRSKDSKGTNPLKTPPRQVALYV